MSVDRTLNGSGLVGVPLTVCAVLLALGGCGGGGGTPDVDMGMTTDLGGGDPDLGSVDDLGTPDGGPVVCAAGTQDNDGDGTCTAACVGDGTSCSSNGTCDDSTGTLACTCDAGFSGADCSTSVCDGVDCGGNGSCSGATGSAVCNCSVGFQDDDGNLTCTAACAGDGSSCSNNGTCDNSTGTIVCTCDVGLGGADCSAVSCGNVDCGNGGTCDDTGSAAVCSCATGFQDLDGDLTCTAACAGDGSSCSNNGTCDDSTGTTVCTCTSGFSGADCSVADCNGIDCGNGGSCDDSGASPVCNCAGGFQDNDNDLTCDAACVGDGSSCSDHGTCADSTGAIACTCDAGYTGTLCDACDTGFVADGADCSIPIAGGLVTGDPGQFGDGSTAASCQEYRNPPAGYTYQGSTGDGVYLIDPFDTGAFEVTCDMTTGGGGFTFIDAALANNDLMLTTNAIAGTCALNGDNPIGTDGGGSQLCQFEIATGFEFNALMAARFQITSRSTGTDTTDVQFRSGDWGGATADCTNHGDVRLGAADDAAPALSLGDSLGNAACGAFTEFDPDEIIGNISGRASTGLSSTLRLEFYENGGQSEGFEWTAGGVFVRRNDHSVTNALTAGDPGQYADGTQATSCAEYFDGRFLNGLFYAAAQDPGTYLVDADGPGGADAVAVDCLDGDSVDFYSRWDRASDPTNDTLASFQALHVDELNPAPANVSLMGEIVEEASSIIWSDLDASFDALSYRLDLTGNVSTEVSVDIRYFGSSQEESALYIYATGASGTTNIVCFQDSVESNADYSVEERALVPAPCADPGGNVNWDGTFTVDIGEPVLSVTLLSFQGDANRGDFSQLFRYRVYTPAP